MTDLRNIIVPKKLPVNPLPECDGDGRLIWEVYEDIPVQVGPVYFVIEKGFRFDWASVPRFLQPFLPQRSIISIASLAHDKGYQSGIPKGICDGMFRDLLAADNQPYWVRLVMVGAVGLFGASAYDAHRRREQAQYE